MKTIYKSITGKIKLFYFKVLLLKSSPVLVYQMGKVASSSIYVSLRKCTRVVHLHRMNPQNIKSVRANYSRKGVTPLNEDLGLYLFENIEKIRKPVKIISLVREPITRNVSAFFENLNLFLPRQISATSNEIQQLVKTFMEEYDHNVPLEWFDKEMKVTTGINVYNHDFPKNLGYTVIEQTPFELLLLRHDLDDDLKEKLIRDFLGISSFKMFRANEASMKNYADKYSDVLDNLNVPVEYAERMLSSKYAQHFYPEEEIKLVYEKWTGQKYLST